MLQHNIALYDISMKLSANYCVHADITHSNEVNPAPFTFQVEVENFVLKMAAEFPSRRDQLIFLINNYDMLLGVLMVTLLANPKHSYLRIFWIYCEIK